MRADDLDIGLAVPTCRQGGDFLVVSFLERFGDDVVREGLNKDILNHNAVRCGKEDLHICSQQTPDLFFYRNKLNFS
jgi:hypothetical protein